MAYARKDLRYTKSSPSFSVVSRLDICAHRTVQVLGTVFDNPWQVINFYDVRDTTSRQALLALDVSATTPTLIMGDKHASQVLVAARHPPLKLAHPD